MFRQFKLETRCALLLAVVRTVFCAYRAWHQSITHDEAFSFHKYLNGPWSDLWSPYFDANHHVLYTFLAKCSVSLLGASEFSMRLPSVIGGFAMMVGIYRVLQPCRSVAVRWIALLALGLHPLLLDFSIAARGYGLSIALLVWAVDAMQRDRFTRAGVLLGFAIAANLTIVFPALALIVVARREMMLLPAAGFAGVICWYPMRGATRAHFYVGTGSVSDSVFNLVQTAILGPAGVVHLVATYVVPVVALSWIAAFLWAWGRWQQAPRSRFLMPLTLLVTLVGVVVAHRYFGVQYPVDRTGLYLWVLAAFSWAVLVDLTQSQVARVGLMLPVVAMTVQFATQLQVDLFAVWPFNAGTKEIALRLGAQCEQRPAGSVSVSSHFTDEGSLNFYRITHGMECLQPIARVEQQPMEGYDFYVLSPIGGKPDQPKEVLYEDPVSGSQLVR